MSLTTTIVVAGREVTVRELRVEEVRQWLADIEAGAIAPDLIGSLINEHAPLNDLYRMTTLKPEDAERMAGSEIGELVDICRRVNPDFFRVRARILEIGQAALAMQRDASGQPQQDGRSNEMS